MGSVKVISQDTIRIPTFFREHRGLWGTCLKAMKYGVLPFFLLEGLFALLEEPNTALLSIGVRAFRFDRHNRLERRILGDG